MELVNFGEDSDIEKDHLLERFMEWAKKVCNKLILLGYFSDYIDPCSGLPMIHQEGNNVYDEVAALNAVLGYSVQNAGCCKIILHPKWGSAVYPATMFTKAPIEHVLTAIAQTESELSNSTAAA